MMMWCSTYRVSTERCSFLSYILYNKIHFTTMYIQCLNMGLLKKVAIPLQRIFQYNIPKQGCFSINCMSIVSMNNYINGAKIGKNRQYRFLIQNIHIAVIMLFDESSLSGFLQDIKVNLLSKNMRWVLGKKRFKGKSQ